MAVQSVLLPILSRQLKDKLVDFCCTRFESLKNAQEQWFKDRDRWLKQSIDDFEYRKSGEGSRDTAHDLKQIFENQNDSLNIVAGFAEFSNARAVDDIFGSRPWYATSPEGKSDKQVAKGLQKHSTWKINRSNLESAWRDAIKKAYDLGEGVVKLRYLRDKDFYERPAVVLIDEKTQKPILTSDGDYIFEDEPIISETEQAPNGQTKVSKIYPQNHPDIDLTKIRIAWQERAIEDERVIYDNVDAKCLYHRDFVTSLTGDSLESNDFSAHHYDRPLNILKDLYNLSKRDVSLLRSSTNEAKSDGAQPDHERGEQEEVNSTEEAINNPNVHVAECYCDYTIKGRRCRLLVIVAVEHKVLIYAEYLANVTPRGRLPFRAVRAFKSHRNRWYGRGFYEAYEKAQDFIDRHLNYIAYRNRFHSNPMKFVKPDNLVGVAAANDLVIAPGKGHLLKPDKTAKDAVDFLVLPDLDNRTWQLMQLMIQIVQVRSGVTSAAQGEVSGLPSTNTATGIESILSSGSVLARNSISELKNCIESGTEFALMLIYSNHDQEETFTYLEGEHPEVITITPEQVKNLHLNVKLLLTRFHQREQKELAQAALTAVSQYYQMPPESRDSARRFFVQVVQSLGFDDAESAFPLLPEPIQQPAPPVPL